MSNEHLEELLNENHYHELMDRIHVTMSMIDTHITQHPACKINKKIYKQVEKAQDCLWVAYQEIGNKIS